MTKKMKEELIDGLTKIHKLAHNRKGIDWISHKSAELLSALNDTEDTGEKCEDCGDTGWTKDKNGRPIKWICSTCDKGIDAMLDNLDCHLPPKEPDEKGGIDPPVHFEEMDGGYKQRCGITSEEESRLTPVEQDDDVIKASEEYMKTDRYFHDSKGPFPAVDGFISGCKWQASKGDG